MKNSVGGIMAETPEHDQSPPSLSLWRWAFNLCLGSMIWEEKRKKPGFLGLK